MYYLLFCATMNIPRLLGYIFHYCYLERVSRGRLIGRQHVINASQRYYEEIMLAYFNLNRFALEPYENKLDKNNQKVLLDTIIINATDLKTKIKSGHISGSLFKGLLNPPTSHFVISTDLESILGALELNTFVSKYHEMRDKDGKDISVFCLYYGLCVRERIKWGYCLGQPI